MTTGPAAPTLLDLDLGFLALSRRLCTSPFYRALRPDERSVVVEALLAARYAPGGEFWFAGKRIPLAVGQFIDSEDEIAQRARVTRKVVRTTYRKLAAAGLMSWSRAHPAGQCPFITTIIDYARISLRGDEAGPPAGRPPGHEGAKNGPAEGPPPGHEGAPSEQGNQGTEEPSETSNEGKGRSAVENAAVLPAWEATGNAPGLTPLHGRVLLTLALDGWQTVAALASALRRSPRTVEEDLRALRRERLVESAERGSPPVVHWRRVPAPEEAAAAAGGRS